MKVTATPVAQVIKKLENLLDSKRVQHSLGVAKVAVVLARKFGCDEKKAELAAILHDCAKSMEKDTPKKYLKKYKIKATTAVLSSPQLLHTLLGPYVAKDIFKIKDKEILKAIRWHTTGRAGMSKLEKIIYIADYIEESRTIVSSANTRKLLGKKDISLDRLVYSVVKGKLKYLKKNKAVVNKDSIKLLNEMKEKTTKNQ